MMPTSDWDNMAPICKEIHRLQPWLVMDCGVGAGKYGVLCREVLDGIWGRLQPKDWTHKICGVEAHGPYRNPAWGAYDWVKVCDFTEESITDFDLVLMIDSLEHLEPEQGRAFLAGLVARNKHVIVSVPNGPMPCDEPVYGNAYERHLATYYGHEFNAYMHTVLHRGLCLVVSIDGNG